MYSMAAYKRDLYIIVSQRILLKLNVRKDARCPRFSRASTNLTQGVKWPMNGKTVTTTCIFFDF